MVDWKKASQLLRALMDEGDLGFVSLDREWTPEPDRVLGELLELEEGSTMMEVRGKKPTAKDIRRWTWESRKETWIQGDGIVLWFQNEQGVWRVGAARLKEAMVHG